MSAAGTVAGAPPTPARRRAGLAVQLVNGGLLALPYSAAFERLPRVPAWVLGAGLGVLHSLAAGAALAAVPAVHPEIPGRLPEPGPFFARQGRGAVAVLIATHVLYGAVVGAAYGAGRRPARPAWIAR
jgi:hypothetical protein